MVHSLFLSRFKWFRKLKGGVWYKHAFTKDASELTLPTGVEFWAIYSKINRYSDVIEIENYNKT